MSEKQHVRVFMGLGTIDSVDGKLFTFKESGNPRFKGSDGDFIRQAVLINQFKGFVEAYNKNQEQLTDNFEILNQRMTDIENRLKELEDIVEEIQTFHESVIKPSHKREKVKESKKQPKRKISLEEIKDLPKEERSMALRDLILKGDVE